MCAELDAKVSVSRGLFISWVLTVRLIVQLWHFSANGPTGLANDIEMSDDRGISPASRAADIHGKCP
jgi:hypothetical protein